jgi:hypothetical protein
LSVRVSVEEEESPLPETTARLRARRPTTKDALDLISRCRSSNELNDPIGIRIWKSVGRDKPSRDLVNVVYEADTGGSSAVKLFPPETAARPYPRGCREVSKEARHP